MKRVLKWALYLVILALMGITALPFLLPRIGWQADPVLSSSMEPALPYGALAFTRITDPYSGSIKEGDILVYRHPQNEQMRICHRVVAIEYIGLQPNFRTKGDANERNDTYLVFPSFVEGVVDFHMPFIGRISEFSRTLAGKVVLLVIPGLLVVATEVRSIWRNLSGRERSRSAPGQVSSDRA